MLVVKLTAACDTRGATPMGSTRPQVRRYQRTQRQAPGLEVTTFDRFPGGCITTRAAVPAANRAEITSQLTTILHYTSRQTLRQALDERSGGRLQLDPPAPRPSGQPT